MTTRDLSRVLMYEYICWGVFFYLNLHAFEMRNNNKFTNKLHKVLECAVFLWLCVYACLTFKYAAVMLRPICSIAAGVRVR